MCQESRSWMIMSDGGPFFLPFSFESCFCFWVQAQNCCTNTGCTDWIWTNVMKQRRQTELRARRCIKRRVHRWWSLVLNEVTCWHCNTFFWCWFSLLTDIVSWLCYFTPPPSGAAFSISSSPPLLSSAPPLPSLNPWEGRTNERLGKSKKQLNFLLFHSWDPLQLLLL